MFSRLGFLGSLGALSFLRLTVLCLLLTLLWLEAGEQSFGRALKEQAKEKRVFKSAGEFHDYLLNVPHNSFSLMPCNHVSIKRSP